MRGPSPRMTMRRSRIFLVALQQFDRDALRAADEADAHAGPDGGGLLGELDALGFDFRGDRVDVLHRHPEMIQPLIGRYRRRVDAIARRHRRDEYVGAAQPDVDPPGAADDLAAEDVLQPGRGRLRVGAAQMNVIPGDYRHVLSSAAALSASGRPGRLGWPHSPILPGPKATISGLMN